MKDVEIYEDPLGNKQVFAGKAGHELRQPLNAIVLTVANLRFFVEGKLGPVELAHVSAKLDRIEQQVAIAGRLLDAAIENAKVD